MEERARILGTICSKFLFLLQYIFLFLISIPAFALFILYRIIATFLIKIHHKDAIFLSSQDAFLSYAKSRDESQLLFSFFCSGTVDIERFREIIESLAKQNPHLTSYVRKKYGYYFWLKEKNFDIKDHVLYYPNLSISTKDEWKRVQKHLYYNTPIHDGMSPWFMHLVPLNPDYEETIENMNFYMVTSYHHCIGDGYSCLHHILKTISDGDPPKLLTPAKTKSSVFIECLHIFTFIFLWPYFTIEMLNQRSIFNPSMLKGKQVYADSGLLEISSVKNIKRRAKIPFAIVLLTCIMGALERFLRKTFDSVPSEIIVAIPKVLWSPHDEINLTNNFVVLYLTLPLNQKHGLARLKEIWDICNSKHTRYAYIFDYVMMKWLGNFIPTFIGQSFYKNDPSSVTLSIAGVEKYPNSVYEGRSIKKENMTKMLNLFSNVGIVFQSWSYGDEISVSVHSKTTIITEEELQTVLDDIEKELQEMNENISQWNQFY